MVRCCALCRPVLWPDQPCGRSDPATAEPGGWHSGIQRRTDRNTVVIYVSDHGEMLGDHYRWRKSLPYEGSAHIPFMIQAPERFGLRKGTVDSTPVCIEDIMPTLLDMADVEAPEGIDGHSLLPLMRDASLIDRPYLHIETAPTYQCLTDGKEKFIWYVEDGREEFFDLTVDPREERNLIHSSSDRAGWWRGELVSVLAGRDEGFSDGMSLIAGRRYPGLGRG